MSAGTTIDESESSANLKPVEDKFAQMVSMGMSQSEAYRKVTGSKGKPETVHVEASRWAASPKVALRIQELRAAAKERATEKYVYEYEDAMREADEALQFARLMGDSKAITSAVALKAKLSGLETEARKNDRPPFEDMTEEELVEGMNRDLQEAGFTLQ